MMLPSICCLTMLGLTILPRSAATTTRCTRTVSPWTDTSATCAMEVP